MPRRKKEHFTVNEIMERLARAEELRQLEAELQAERELQRLLAEMDAYNPQPKEKVA